MHSSFGNRFAVRALSLSVVAFGCVHSVCAGATEYHVAKTGSDGEAGTADKPFLTIQKAATVMQPGDICTVHAGLYRERVDPPRGGTSESARIVYRANPGDAVYVTGAERITSWAQEGGVWKAVVPNTTFADGNPFSTAISGDYLVFGGDHHLGAVYLDGVGYAEKLSDIDVANTPKTWRAQVDGTDTTIWANFDGANPNDGNAEINVRRYVFAPSAVGLSYLTVEGFHLLQAATQWAPPTAHPQDGLLMTNFGFAWVIQNNDISDSRTVCIASGLGTGNHSYDIDAIGNHVIRNNVIHRCGEAGVAGSHGLPASLIEKNLIEEINPLNEFGGWEGGAIKIHSAVDVVIRNNVIRKVHGPSGGAAYAIWLDWQGQGSRVTGNVIYDIDNDLMVLEMNHGPTLLDNNVFVGHGNGIGDVSDNTVYVHNLFVSSSNRTSGGDGRTPGWFAPHTTNGAGTGTISSIDTKYFNNIFVNNGLGLQQGTGFASDYGVFYGGAQGTSWGDAHSKVVSGFDVAPAVTSLPNGATVSFTTDSAPKDIACPLVTRDLVGVSSLTNQGIEHHDGSPITVDTDMTGAPRDATHPTAGPLEAGSGLHTITLLVGPDAPIGSSGGASGSGGRTGAGGSVSGNGGVSPGAGGSSGTMGGSSGSAGQNQGGSGNVNAGGRSAGGSASSAGGSMVGPDGGPLGAGSAAPGGDEGGCSCSTPVARDTGALGRIGIVLLALGVAFTRRASNRSSRHA